MNMIPTNSMDRLIRIFLVAMLALAVSPRVDAGITTVTLRSTVRISAEGPITLGQIGTIEGDQRQELVGVSIESLLKERSEGWRGLTGSDLRVLLDQQPNILAGSIVIKGSDVALRRMDARVVPDVVVDEDEVIEHEVPSGPVVKDHIERWVHDRYRIGSDPLRIAFRDQDQPFLSTSTADRLVEIREISKRGRTAIRVIVLNGYEIIAEQALIFDVEIQRTVLIARERIDRGSILSELQVMSERRWVSPEEEAADAEGAIGMALSKSVNSGELIETRHIELPLVIRRGDIVSAKSIAGSVVVTVRGRAKADARQGEVVELESMSGETRFNARAVGKGRALILRDSDLKN